MGARKKVSGPYRGDGRNRMARVLVDTSVWVSYLRAGDAHLQALLQGAEVVCHPFIVGELACGNIQNRQGFLSLLQTLPQAPTADQEEVLYFIEHDRLMGVGIGFVDVHLLASARLSRLPLWTSDKSLKEVAARLNVGYRQKG